MKKKIFIPVLLAVLLLPVTVRWGAAADNLSDESTKIASTGLAAPAGTGMSLFSHVKDYVDEYLDDGTEYAVYLAYPQQSAECYLYNSHAMRSASMI